MAKQRKTFARSNLPLLMSVQYTTDSNGHTALHVPMLQMLQTMLINTDVHGKIQDTKQSLPRMHLTHEYVTYFKEKQLLSEGRDLELSLIL